MKKIIESLGITQENFGSCIGAEKWIETKNSGLIESINPASGEVIANVFQCSEDDYEDVIKASQESFKEWRMVPAPIRGQLVREMGEELRKNKDALGSLVALEMGKILSLIHI